MKKVILLSVMLVASMAISAQTKIVPQMKKGLKKVYATTATVSVGGQKDVKMSSETKYTVTEANADGYVVDMVVTSFATDADVNDVAGQMISATQEMMKDVNVRLQTNKDGQVVGIKNYAEVKKQIDAFGAKIVDKLMESVPQLSEVMSKDALKQQIQESVNEQALIRSLKEADGVLMLNGKTPMTGAQEEYVNEKGVKMKRMYFVNGKSIVTNGSANITKDELKAMIIEQVEKTMPAQAEIVKQNIDQLLSSGMLKVDIKETSTYEMGDDSWVKSVKTESNSEFVGTKTVVKSETVCK
ncbi:MAG: hypothetical protein IIU12_00010 [Prevotella sp.]|jgi:hypothetical protein|nr:hypothetical protein [Prevotella sp.]